VLHQLAFFAVVCVAGDPLDVKLTYPPTKEMPPFTGRVFVVVSKKPIGDRPFSQSWFSPEPFFAQDAKDWKPDVPLEFRPSAAFPQPWNRLPAGTYHVQAILDRDLGGRDALSSPGNLYSKAVQVTLDPAKPNSLSLRLDRTATTKAFAETPSIKLFEMDSKLLTDWNGRPTKMRAGVILPKSFAESPGRKYPVVYEIPGFGGDVHYTLSVAARKSPPTDLDGTEAIHVVLDPSCRLGHHVFADSANNGPVGQALVEEFIPALEAKFRGNGKRLVLGHSSGGWSSLWLQITYPDVFAGVWSTAPDPVDFRDFQRIDLYRPGVNMFTDDAGQPRPIARQAGKVKLLYRDFSNMEDVLGRGGQLSSFEAVFSPRGPDKEPRTLWDRVTGAVDPVTAEAWKKYDIRLKLEREWPILGPKLAGKLHVYTGGDDTYYLEGATRLLGDSLKKLGSDAVVEIFPGRNHSNLIDADLRLRMHREMAKALAK
jgi:pimeloyl-ACP methyl ester carboxylesterase